MTLNSKAPPCLASAHLAILAAPNTQSTFVQIKLGLPTREMNQGHKIHLSYSGPLLILSSPLPLLSSPKPIFSAQVSRLQVGLWMKYFHPLWCCSVWRCSFLWGPTMKITSWQVQILEVPLWCLPSLGNLLVATGLTWHESHLFAIPVSPCLRSLLVFLVLRTNLLRFFFFYF